MRKLTLHHMKEVRVIVSGEDRTFVTELLDSIGATGYTVLAVTAGKGHGGLQQSHFMFGEIESLEGPELRLLIPRPQLTASVSRLLAEHQVVDLEVSDPPIEELIGKLFRQGSLEEPGP